VLGVKVEIILDRFRTMLPKRFEVADGPAVFQSVLIDVDEHTGRARSIERVDRLHEGT